MSRTPLVSSTFVRFAASVPDFNAAEAVKATRLTRATVYAYLVAARRRGLIVDLGPDVPGRRHRWVGPKPKTPEELRAELFEVFIVGAFGTTTDADYHRHAMNPATAEDWKDGLIAVRNHVLKGKS